MSEINWQEIDTLLLDIDGTLLDQYFDNVLWGQLLPARHAELKGLTVEGAKDKIEKHFREVAHTLDYYRIEYWVEYTGVDLIELHHEFAHLIEFRPGTKRFLDWIRSKSMRSILVTNADPDCFAVKDCHCHLSEQVQTIVSCHEYDRPKESEGFWTRLNTEHPFDRARTLFVDDNEVVLEAARKYGITHLRTIRQPDLKRPARDGLAFQSINDLMELVPSELIA